MVNNESHRNMLYKKRLKIKSNHGDEGFEHPQEFPSWSIVTWGLHSQQHCGGPGSTIIMGHPQSIPLYGSLVTGGLHSQQQPVGGRGGHSIAGSVGHSHSQTILPLCGSQ